MAGDGPVRYVVTSAIRGAVQGREAEILDALGIAWRNGHPHIRCPYRDHADNDPSWRWDEKRGRALCTCIPKSNSIFDVVAKTEGLDFEQAKLRVAELLGRNDLIKFRDEGGIGQKSDAASLLDPPAALRDDSLPRRYLAGRLGLGDPDFIAAPATKTAGWKALPYYDPPARKGGKPQLVGAPPCAIFATIAADGRPHGHRIYLNPDGAGKAELGTAANGKLRDPKKSARRPDGAPSTAGCCTVWGNIETAPHAIVAEGIETAAAIAYAFGEEIGAGEIAVCSAITAGGLEAFTPWPAATRLTIAADRDEAKPGAGFKRGERAARTLALRLLHAEQRALDLRLALPGAAGTSTDFLDVLLADGAAGVRGGILGSVPLVPTAKEIEDFEARKAVKGEIAITRQRAPLPPSLAWPMEYQTAAPTSEIWAHKRVSSKTAGDDAAEERWVPVCTPFSVVAVLQMANADEAYGLRLMLRDLGGEMRAVDIDRSQLSRLGGAEVRARLLGAGMRFVNGGENIVIDILKEVRPPATITVVAHTGWHRCAGELRFIRPDGNVGDTVELLHDARLAADVVKSGTLAGWQAALRAAVTAGCPHWVLGAAAGFAGTLINLCALDTCGLSFSGPTSRGKTSAQQLAVSAWSSSKLTDGGLLKSLKTTENAIELLARTSTGTVLALDELAHAEGRVVGRLIYALAGNTGKNRMNAAGALRPLATWSSFVLLSGEKSLEQKVVGDDGQWSGGMAARFTDIDVTDVNHRVDDDTLTAMRGIFANFGHAGPRFAAALTKQGYHRDPDLLRARILRTAGELAGEGGDAALIRAATPLAVVAIAGKLAQGFGILPDEADIEHAVKWAWASFGGSAEARALDPETQMLGNLQRAIAERWEVTIRAVGNTRLTSRDAIAWYDDEVIYVPTTRICELAGGILKEQAIARLLSKDYLAQKDPNRLTVRYVPKVGHVRCYALKRSVFGRPEAPPPATSGRWDRDDE